MFLLVCKQDRKGSEEGQVKDGIKQRWMEKERDEGMLVTVRNVPGKHVSEREMQIYLEK